MSFVYNATSSVAAKLRAAPRVTCCHQSAAAPAAARAPRAAAACGSAGRFWRPWRACSNTPACAGPGGMLGQASGWSQEGGDPGVQVPPSAGGNRLDRTSNSRAACSTCPISTASSVAVKCTVMGGCAPAACCCSPGAAGCAACCRSAAAAASRPPKVISRRCGAPAARAWGAVPSTKACSSSSATGPGADSCRVARRPAPASRSPPIAPGEPPEGEGRGRWAASAGSQSDVWAIGAGGDGCWLGSVCGCRSAHPGHRRQCAPRHVGTPGTPSRREGAHPPAATSAGHSETSASEPAPRCAQSTAGAPGLP